MMEIVKEFTFDAAHRLPNVPEGHKCGRIHGHTYRVVLTLEGDVDEKMGWVVDFGEVSQAWKRIVDIWLDHRYLNDMPGMSNPTAEFLCMWVLQSLAPTLPLLVRVDVWETPTSCASYDIRKHTELANPMMEEWVNG